MGSTVSRADVPGPLPPSPSPPLIAATDPNEKQGTPPTNGSTSLPSPTKYEDMQREILMALRPEMFEGMRLEFAKPLNEQFALIHSVYMGNMEIPTQGSHVYKCPLATYEFGANVITRQVLPSAAAGIGVGVQMLMVGRITSEGRMTGRVKYDLSDRFSLRWQAQFSRDPEIAQQLVDLDINGSDWNGQLKYGNNGFYGLNYMQSVTRGLSLGCEVYYMDEQRKSGLGIAARQAVEKYIATLQASSVGLVSMSYLHKVGDKTSLIADFLYNSNSGEATTSLGYDCLFSRAHVRGKVDSNGVLGAYLEERITPGVQFILSGEIDHWKKDYKFGFGLQLGE